MLAEHLKPVDYATMLQRKTVGDIAVFLQGQPLYKESLEGINPKAIHRGQLEVLLRTGVFNRFAKLIRYADDNAKHFGHIAVMETEIELILMKLHSLSDQDNEMLRQNMISKLPLYIGSYTSFPLEELADSSVNLSLRYWCLTSEHAGCIFRTLETIKNRFDEAGIEIPFPQVQVHQ